jgi:hypothetical protein
MKFHVISLWRVCILHNRMEQKDPKAVAATTILLAASLIVSALLYLIWKVFIFIFILVPPVIFQFWQRNRHNRNADL